GKRRPGPIERERPAATLAAPVACTPDRRTALAAARTREVDDPSLAARADRAPGELGLSAAGADRRDHERHDRPGKRIGHAGRFACAVKRDNAQLQEFRTVTLAAAVD